MSQLTPQEQFARLVFGHGISQAVYVAAKLGIADLLKDGPRSVEELASVTATHARSLYRLMRALASVGIFVEREDGRFALTPLAEVLRDDVPGSQRATAVLMGEEVYQAWGELILGIKTGESVFRSLHGCSYFEFLSTHPEREQVFSDAMTSLNRRKTVAMLEAYDFSGINVLADVGGGNGHNLVEVLRAYPAMRGILFEQPQVMESGRRAIEEAGLAGRCQAVGGSFLEGVPAGADGYLLRHIVHNWNDDDAVRILRNVHRSMTDDARLLVIDRVIPRGNEPMPGKFMDLTMLVLHGGIERTEAEFQELLEAAGFQLTRIVPTSAEVSIVEGKKR